MGMREILLPWNQLPQEAVRVDLANPINAGLIDVWQFNNGRSLLRNTSYAQGVNVPTVGQGGVGMAPTADGTPLELASNSGTVLPTGPCTIIVALTEVTTARRAIPLFACNAAGTATTECHAFVPFTDGKVYWRYGDGTGVNANIGPLKGFDVFAFTAGGAAGRQIWQNGVKLVGDSNTITRTSTSNPLVFGDGSQAKNSNVNKYLFAVYSRQFSDAELAAVTANPAQIFEPQSVWVPMAAAGTNVTPGVGAVAITGYAPSVSQSAFVSLSPGVGSVAITGYAPTITQGATTSVLPAVGSITFTGYAPSVTQGGATALNPGAGALAITGYSPTIAQSGSVSLAPGVGSLTITGYAPIVNRTASASLAPGAGSMSFTGYAPTVYQGAAMTTISVVQPYITVYFWKRTA